MRIVLLLAALALPLLADENADRAAITNVIGRLNDYEPAGVYTIDADGVSTLDGLRRGKIFTYSIPLQSLDAASSGPPAVVISHEPWDEAAVQWPRTPVRLTNPSISPGPVRFITPDVALADAIFRYLSKDGVETTPLLLILRREADAWKVAAVRALVPLQGQSGK